jgi:hypothetical protein
MSRFEYYFFFFFFPRPYFCPSVFGFAFAAFAASISAFAAKRFFVFGGCFPSFVAFELIAPRRFAIKLVSISVITEDSIITAQKDQ